LKRNSSSMEFASVFGSCRRGDADRLSDIDILLICEEKADEPAIISSLTKLGPKLGREVHSSIFTLKGFEERIRNHDYLIASILDDSDFVFGDDDAFLDGKKTILTEPVDMESVRFNRRMGLSMLDRVNDRLRDLLFNRPSSRSCEPSITHDYDLLGCLKDYHLGLGYLAASARMKQLNKAVSLRQLLISDDYSFIRDLILIEKSIIRKGTVNLDLQSLFNYSNRPLNASRYPSTIEIL